MAITNSELWTYAQQQSPEFDALTASNTYEYFKSQGFGSTSLTEKLVSSWVDLILIPVLQKIDFADARDYFADKGCYETYDTPMGGIIQRMSVGVINPINSQTLDIQDLTTYSPFVVRKPSANDRFYKQNFSYSNTITLNPTQLRTVFNEETGMSNLTTGIINSLNNAYKIQKMLNFYKVLNEALNSTDHPLQSTQTIELDSWTDGDPSEDDVIAFVRAIKNVLNIMDITPATSMFNAAGYRTIQDKGRLKLLVRSDVWTDSVLKRIGLYHPEYLDLGIDIVPVSNFGYDDGEVYADADYTTKVYPVYDSLGAVIGFSETEGATEATYTDTQVYYKESDDNADTLAVLIDNGLIFMSEQVGYQVNSIFNPRILCEHIWCNKPNSWVCFDEYHTLVKFTKPSE